MCSAGDELDVTGGGSGEVLLQREEQGGRSPTVPVAGQQLGRQTGVEVLQPSPLGQCAHVVGEGLRVVGGAAPSPPSEHRAVRREEGVVEPLQLLEVPPGRDGTPS